jgi:hypothetical protein
MTWGEAQKQDQWIKEALEIIEREKVNMKLHEEAIIRHKGQVSCCKVRANQLIAVIRETFPDSIEYI